MYRFTLIVVAALSVAWRHGLEWLDEPPEPLRV